MILLNCAFNAQNGKKPMYETFDNVVCQQFPALQGWVGIFTSIFVIFIVILAVIIAVRCNPESPAAYVFLALFFSEIYLIQFFIRKYIIQEKNYCKGLF